MKNTCLLLIYILMPLVFVLSIETEGFPQSQMADSLLKIINSQPDNQDKADNLLNLGKHYYYINFDSSQLYYEQAYILSGKLNYLQGQADALYMKSLICKKKADFKSSLRYIEKYIELVLYLEDSLRLAKGYNHLGNIHQELRNFDLAIFYCQKSLAFSMPLNYTIGLYANYNCIGSVFKGKSAYDSSAYYYLKAVDLCRQIGDERNLTTILTNLGEVYFFDEQYDNARKYFNMSLEINQKNRNTASIALNFTNLGRVASENGEFKLALDYYNQAEEIYVGLEDQRGMADMDNNYGDLYFKQGKYNLALEKFDKAIEGYKKIQFTKGFVLALINKAAVLSEMGNIGQAMSLQDSCLALANQLGDKELRLDILGNISNNYEKTGNFRKAFDFLTQHYKLKDTIYDINKTKAIYEQELKYNKEQDQARILALEKDNLQKTNQRNAYMFTGLGIIVLALFILIYFRQRAVHDKIMAQQKIRQLEEEQKMMAAKLLVEGQEDERKRIATELHDGLGVLLSATKMQFSIISDRSPENKELIEKANRMLEQASGDVRKISHNMMPGLLTKLGFYEAVEDLFENIGDNKDLNAICSISGNPGRLPENKEIMLYRIVQEMVNNTLKHAEARNIDLQIHVLPGMLDIIYADDGIGFNFMQKLEFESIGLKSIQSRINFLNGNLAVESKPGMGVKYSLQVPV